MGLSCLSAENCRMTACAILHAQRLRSWALQSREARDLMRSASNYCGRPKAKCQRGKTIAA